MISSTFSGNSARYGGALSAFGNTDLISNTLSTNSAGWGGAVFVAENWVVNVTGSSMSNNSSGWGGGGAIYNHGGGTINVVLSALAGNITSGSGGVVYNELGTIGLIASTSWGNSATGEGGVIANYDQATVTNSTFHTNTAAKGGGVASGLSRSRVMVTNGTLSGNSASTYAGGIYNYGGPITITNSIIANSVTGGNCSGSIIDGGYNLDSADSCGFSPANQSVTIADAKLAPLADNGGGIPTMALLAGSPAIDAGGDAVCAATDQRGASRPQDGNGDGLARCDMGAFERAVPDALLASGGSGQTASISSLFGQPLQATARDSLGSSLHGLTVTFSSPVVGASGVLAEGSNVFTANTSASGVATTTLRANSIAGSYVVTASIGAISSTYSLTNTAPATVDLASSANPSAFGHPIALTATVTSAGGTPTGSVTFVDAASTLGSSALSGGVAALVISSLAPGNHSITASYGGSPYFDSSTSSVLTQTVNLEPAVGDYRIFLPAVMRIYDEGR